ncbi:MAG: Na+/H+ antiporter subunit E, partial [Aggregatilineales bacterium]
SVAWIVIQPDLPVKTSTFEISTEDTSENSLVAALSAYSITITPGEMVIDFVRDENDEFDEQTMIVHVLNRDKSNAETLSRDQVRRVRWIKRLLAIN